MPLYENAVIVISQMAGIAGLGPFIFVAAGKHIVNLDTVILSLTSIATAVFSDSLAEVGQKIVYTKIGISKVGVLSTSPLSAELSGLGRPSLQKIMRRLDIDASRYR